ncbi:hypothetical protein ILYODFUR_035052, partial [Ilyodon furcidens]
TGGNGGISLNNRRWRLGRSFGSATSAVISSNHQLQPGEHVHPYHSSLKGLTVIGLLCWILNMSVWGLFFLSSFGVAITAQAPGFKAPGFILPG